MPLVDLSFAQFSIDFCSTGLVSRRVYSSWLLPACGVRKHKFVTRKESLHA